MIIDIHVHTSEHSLDADVCAREQVKRAIQAGLNGLVFMDHDYCWHPEELAQLRNESPADFHILSGAEIMFPELHLLLLGCKPGEQPVFDSPKAATSYVQNLGGCSIVAHPFSRRKNVTTRDILASGAHGMEVFNGRRKAISLDNVFSSRQLGLAETGGSDSHSLEDGIIGSVATWLPDCTGPLDSWLIQKIMSSSTRAWRSDKTV